MEMEIYQSKSFRSLKYYIKAIIDKFVKVLEFLGFGTFLFNFNSIIAKVIQILLSHF